MALLALDDVHKSYPDRPLLSGVTLLVQEDTRVGIVGPNGCGKSTLMRVLAGVEPIDSGRRTMQRDLRIGFLSQEVIGLEGTVRDSVRAGLEGRERVLARIEAIHTELGDRELSVNAMEALLAELARLETRRDRLGGHDVEHRVEELIERVGLPDPEAQTLTLSGGEKRRTALARVLLAEPDVLLLDEPTNHLDAFVIDWLEDHLIATRTPVVMVTHDRYFLDRVVDRVIDVDQGELVSYEGGYAGYLRGRAARQLAQHRAEVARLGLLRRETAWMRRGPPARTTKANARIDRYHKLLDDAPDAPPGELVFKIPPGPRLGSRVIRARGVALEMGGRTLARNLDLDIGQGVRLGIVGPNGAGKTTLVNTLAGRREPDAGTVELGETTKLSAIDQMRSDLDPNKTVVEEINGGSAHVRIGEQTIRVESFLDGFLFPGERKHEKVGQLSGGERNRILLAKLLLQGGNVLLLDEPTNDLDLPTLRALEEALVAFDGTVVVVSHDRWFLDRVATEILHLDGHGNALRFGGDISTLLARAAEERRVREKAAAPAPAPKSEKRGKPKGSKRLSTWQQRELDELPAKIEAAETAVAELTEQISDPALYSGPAEQRAKVEAAQREAVAAVETLYARWEELETLRDGD